MDQGMVGLTGLARWRERSKGATRGESELSGGRWGQLSAPQRKSGPSSRGRLTIAHPPRAAREGPGEESSRPRPEAEREAERAPQERSRRKRGLGTERVPP